ncbi:MAG: S-methyl-5'-thioadenosine phosphorylase [Chloroflexi bacterium]|nr:S-methyl-5'-thioadenosine phosphorylase [Chloroflexota bacterium]MBV9601905.1 S-methyl-5'-thioadenosine phosphorylase [Chloroflexota bacterium]
MGLPELLQPVDRAEVGVFGGSGFYSLMEGPVEQLSVQTPYGAPSDTITLGRMGDVRVAFLPRHGPHHHLPPHMINYRANVWAMAQLGVTRLIAPTVAGSLQPSVKPGEFVVCDQFVDRTYAREQTYYDGPRVVHISSADPYCPDLRVQSIEVGRGLGIPVHERGTVVVIQGPRFSTRAESQWFSRQGWEVINMTQYPEVVLARELAMCYVNIALITDYDTGLEGEAGIEPVSVAEVVQVMNANNDRVRRLIQALVPRLAGPRACPCARALENAVIS